MAFKALVSDRSTEPRQYAFPSDANEREMARMANKADQNYLTELKRLIDSRKFFKYRLKSTYSHVQARISYRQPAVTDQRYLPSEILGRIFALVDYEPHQRFKGIKKWTYADYSLVSAEDWILESPLNICRVCRRWREIALSTPRLWNSLIIDVRKKNPEQMMEHWFKHARAVPIDVTIRQQSQSRRSTRKQIATQKLMLSLVVLIGSHIHQVRSLKISCMDNTDRPGQAAPNLTIILSTLQLIKAPLWTSLVIDSMDTYLSGGMWTSLLPAVPPQTCHRLTSLQIRGYLPSTPFFAHVPSQLRTLKLDVPSSNKTSRADRDLLPDLLALLAGLPQLERLRLQGRDRNLSTRPSSMPNQIVRLPCLKKLTVGGYYMASHLVWIEAPNLHALTVRGATYPPGEVDENSVLVQWNGIHNIICTFVEKSGSSISKLSFKEIGKGLQSRPLAACLWAMNELKHLAIVELPGTYLLDMLMDILTLSDTQKPWLTFCPALETLEWRTMTNSRVLDWQRLLEAREGLNIIRRRAKDPSIAFDEKLRYLYENMGI